MNRKFRQSLVVSLVATTAISGLGINNSFVSAEGKSEYADGVFVGSGYGYYSEGAKKYPIKVDVTIKDGKIVDISKHKVSSTYEYPDDPEFVRNSEKIIGIVKNGSSIDDTINIITKFEKEASKGQNAVEDTEFDAVTGATRSALGITSAIKDALNISKNAKLKTVKKEVRMVTPNEKVQSKWLGEIVNLSELVVDVINSDDTIERVKYSDFEKKNLEVVLSFDNNIIEFQGDTIKLETPNKAYDVTIQDKENHSIKDSFRVVAKNRYFIEDDLYYRIGDGEFKKASATAYPVPLGYSVNNYSIDISEDDFGKTVELKSTSFTDPSDNEILEEEYRYKPIVLEKGKNSVFIKGRGDASSEDIIYVNPKKFDPRGIRITFNINEDESSPEDKLINTINKYSKIDSDELKKAIDVAKKSLDKNRESNIRITELRKELDKVNEDINEVLEIKLALLEGREIEKSDKYKSLTDREAAEEIEIELYEKASEIEEKIEGIESTIVSDEGLMQLRNDIINAVPGSEDESDISSEGAQKSEIKANLQKALEEFMNKFSYILNIKEESLEKGLYLAKVKKAQEVLENEKGTLISEYDDMISQLFKATEKLKDYKVEVSTDSDEKREVDDDKKEGKNDIDKDKKENIEDEKIKSDSNKEYIDVPKIGFVGILSDSFIDKSKLPEKSVTRIHGNDRFSTSVELSKKTYESSDTVIIVNGASGSDALVSVPLSQAINAPILLVKNNEIPDIVKNEIKRLGAKNVIIIGGNSTISDNVVAKLNGYKTSRIGGVDRYNTSNLIAEKILSMGNSSNNITLVNGKNPIDAISISGINQKNISPVLLVDDLSSYKEIGKIINLNNIKDVTLVGGINSISKDIENEIATTKKVSRIAGKDRYETSLLIATQNATHQEIIVTSGINYIDALTTGSYALNKNAVVLLSDGNNFNEGVKDYIKNSKSNRVVIVGGKMSIASHIENIIGDIVK